MIYSLTFFTNFNVIMNSFIMCFWICFGPVPCIVGAIYAFLWQLSLTICAGFLNCLSLIHFSISNQWTWIHDWKTRSIHAICALIIFLHALCSVGTDLYKVKGNQDINAFKIYQVLVTTIDITLDPGSLSSVLVGRAVISPSGGSTHHPSITTTHNCRRVPPGRILITH